MEIIFEVIAELLLGLVEWIVDDSKISKWIRYPIIIVSILFVLAVLFGLLFLGIIIVQKDIVAGIFMIVVGIVMILLFIHRIRKDYLILKSKKSIEEKLKD